MTPERWKDIRPILESALELGTTDRVALLERECPDVEIRREVESLLAAHDRAGAQALNDAAPPPPDLAEQASYRLLVGKRVGAYKIHSEIAVGGMGAVYRASRDDGQYRQDVALKIVRSELGSSFTSERFRNERQILASLSHPNIARILDGGVTSEGIPYFVMELIEGLPLIEYCDQHELTIPQRLKLFLAVCSAVHYAHQHLIVHRDIKPNNILVTAAGVPKLLDFGIAKILDTESSQATALLTRAGILLMTPEYASPEQFCGGRVTTATDVYSLGLILYELLTGRRAHDVAGHTPREIARLITEKDPDKPSSVVLRSDRVAMADAGSVPQSQPIDGCIDKSVSELRATTPQRLRRALRGDLDNIVMKALRKESAGRYVSVDRFADDVQRHLLAQPVLARRNTARYQVGRFIARHKIVVAAATTVTLTLVVGLFITLHEAHVAQLNELRAERRFDEVRSLANSLVFEIHDSIRQLPGSTKAREMLIKRAQEYLERLSAEASTNVALLRELAETYEKLAAIQGDFTNPNVGDVTAALQSYRKSVALMESAAVLGPTNPAVQRDLVRSYLMLARALSQSGKLSENDLYLQKAQRMVRSLSVTAQDDKQLQYLLAKTYEFTAKRLTKDRNMEDSLRNYRNAAAIYEALHEAQPNDATYLTEVSFSHKHLGAVLAVQKQYAAALEQYQAARAIDEKRIAADPQNLDYRYAVTFDYSDIGYIVGKQGDVDQALEYYRKSLEIRSAMAAEDPDDARTKRGMATVLTSIGNNLVRKKEYAAAIDAYQRSRTLSEELAGLGAGNSLLRYDVAVTEQHIAQVYAEMAFAQSPAGELSYCRESLKWNRRAWSTWTPPGPTDANGTKLPVLDADTDNIGHCNRAMAPVASGSGAT